MAVEGTTLYTVRDLDVVVTDIKPGIQSYSTKGTFVGRTPLVLVGGNDEHKKFVACATRDGKGLAIYHNDAPFKNVWTQLVSANPNKNRMQMTKWGENCTSIP